MLSFFLTLFHFQSGCKNFPNGLASKICRVVFQNVQNQSLSQPDRCSVYTILSNFLDTKMEGNLKIKFRDY